MKKDCAFQYWDGYKTAEDTGLITLKEAEELKDKWIKDFKEQIEDGNNPEIAIWVNMEYPENYRETCFHLHGNDCIVKDGRLYELKLLV